MAFEINAVTIKPISEPNHQVCLFSLVIATPLYVVSILFWFSLYSALYVGAVKAMDPMVLLSWFNMTPVAVYPFLTAFCLFLGWIFYFNLSFRSALIAIVIPPINLLMILLATIHHFL